MSDAFPSIFAELRRAMRQAAPGMDIAEDTPTTFTLKTPWIERRTGQPAWFGSIAIKKSYVSYHLIPLYSLPALNELVPQSLVPRRQGKTCFNFKKADPALFEDIRLLTEAAARMEPDLKAAIGG